MNAVELSAGYARWASTYDGPNPAIEAEEPVVRALLGGLPPPGPLAPRVAIDVACGTGRHGAYLAALGYAVTGVDATTEMLALAAEKVPVATFKVGSNPCRRFDWQFTAGIQQQLSFGGMPNLTQQNILVVSNHEFLSLSF